MQRNPDWPAPSPLAFGLACFAISTFALAGFFAGYVQGQHIATLTFFVGGIGMALSAIAAYVRGSTFHATWLGGYAAFFAAVSSVVWLSSHATLNGSGDIGWIAFAWGIFTAYIFAVSLKARAALTSLVLALMFVVFLFAWIANAFNSSPNYVVSVIAGALAAIVAAVESFWTVSRAVPVGADDSLTDLGEAMPSSPRRSA